MSFSEGKMIYLNHPDPAMGGLYMQTNSVCGEKLSFTSFLTLKVSIFMIYGYYYISSNSQDT